MATIPAGSLYISGYGDGPGGQRFYSPAGADLGQPDSGFSFGPSPGGFVRMSDGNLAISGAGSPFNSSATGVIDGTDISLLIEAVSPFAYIGGFCLGVNASGNYYTARISGGNLKIAKFSAASDTATTTWDIAYNTTLYGTSIWAMAITPAGDTLYIWMRGNFAQPDANKFKIHIFDLTGSGSYVGKLDDTNWTENAPGSMSLQVNASNEIIAAYRTNGVSGNDGVIRRYSSSGTILNTYLPTGTGNTSNPMCTSLDETGAGFWYWTYTDDAATSSSAAYEHLSWAGSILHGPFYPSDGGFEFDSPFVVLSLDVGTVPITTPPSISTSTVDCHVQPGSATPATGEVLPPVAGAITLVCAGDGAVPSAPDADDSEDWA